MPKFNQNQLQTTSSVTGSNSGIPTAQAVRDAINSLVPTMITQTVPVIQGPPGNPGSNGSNGTPGPNQVNTTTATNITGILKGNGSLVSAASAPSDYVATGDGRLSDARTPLAHSHAPGDVTGTAVVTADSRLSNARTPTAHASTHVTGSTDVIPDVVAGGNSGLMPGADKTKLNGITGVNTGDQTLPVGGTPALTLSTANSAGVSPNFLRRDDTILAFDATVPSTQAFGDSAAVGSATVAARRDHKHAMPAAPTIASLSAQAAKTTFTAITSASPSTWTPVAGTNVYTFTPGASVTLNMGTVPAAVVGQIIYLVVTTSGTSGFTITFGTNIRYQTSTLVTSATSAKKYVIAYLVESATSILEMSRTTVL